MNCEPDFCSILVDCESLVLYILPDSGRNLDDITMVGLAENSSNIPIR